MEGSAPLPSVPWQQRFESGFVAFPCPFLVAAEKYPHVGMVVEALAGGEGDPLCAILLAEIFLRGRASRRGTDGARQPSQRGVMLRSNVPGYNDACQQ